ncbi:hypothetical protein D018_0740A, partial [Vibrio parahaemolyticus VP2007-007]
MHKHFADIVLN